MDENPFEERCCADCVYLKEVVSLWCGNQDAIKYRGTQIPGIIHCKFWNPDWKHIPKEFKL